MPRLLLGPLLAAVCTAGAPGPAAIAPANPDARAEDDARAAPRPADPSLSIAAPTEPPVPLAVGDACPDAPESVNGFDDDDGCPDELPADLAAVVGVLDGVVFAVEKDRIREDVSRPALDRLIAALVRYPAVEIEIGVHEDDRRKGEYGRCLSCRRAQAIAEDLIAHGIDHQRLIARGYGPDRPIASNATAAGRAQNRRIEIKLRGATSAAPIAAPLAAPTAAETKR